MTLPALYEHYEHEVDHLAAKGSHDLKKLYKKVDAQVLSKIPRGPAAAKKDWDAERTPATKEKLS